MKNGELKMENEKPEVNTGEFSTFRTAFSTDVCPACGTKAVREDAQYCLVCGKILSEDYQPLDTLRSAHRLQGKTFLVENQESEEIEDLFARDENTVAHTAWACFVYSMVPYLGILFIPFTFVFGGFGVVVASRYPHLGGRRMALVSIGMSFVVLAIQLFLWWLLYIIPEIGRGI